jgi:hypothetical protein
MFNANTTLGPARSPHRPPSFNGSLCRLLAGGLLLGFSAPGLPIRSAIAATSTRVSTTGLDAKIPQSLRGDLVAFWDFGAPPVDTGTVTNLAPLGGAALDGKLLSQNNRGLPSPDTGGSGAARQALRFDQARRQYVRINAPVLPATAQGYTYGIRFRLDALNTGANRMSILESFAPPPDKYGWTLSLSVNSDNRLVASTKLANNWDGSAKPADDSPALETGRWYHAVVTVHRESRASVITLRLDGKTSATGTLKNTSALKPVAGLNIGTYRDANGRWFHGAIQELAIWDRPLSETEIGLLFPAP